MKLLTPGKDGELVLDFDDVVQRSVTVVRDGEVDVAAAPGAGLRRTRGRDTAAGDAASHERRRSRCRP